MMQSLADSGVLWVLLFAAIVVIYFLPTLIGMARGVDRLALVFVVNLIGTFIGWPAALILAFGPRRLPPEPPWPEHQGTIPGQRGACVSWTVGGAVGSGRTIFTTVGENAQRKPFRNHETADPGFEEQLARYRPAG